MQGKNSRNTKHFPALDSAKRRHVCQPREQTIASVCGTLASLASHSLQCLGDGSAKHFSLLRQPPPLHFNSPLVTQAAAEPPGTMPDGCSLLGWQCMVAPTHKTALQASSRGAHTPAVGALHKLPGRQDASYQMAPSLFDVVQTILERKQVSPEGIETHLAKIQHVERYDRAFRCLWALMLQKHMDPLFASVDQVAGCLLVLDSISPSEAKHAYCACLLLPGFEHLRFMPTLKACKREWNMSYAKYTDFWDASRVLDTLKATPLNWESPPQVRDGLIIIMRLLHLARSIYLARAFRSISFQDDRAFLLLRRKCSLRPMWE